MIMSYVRFIRAEIISYYMVQESTPFVQKLSSI